MKKILRRTDKLFHLIDGIQIFGPNIHLRGDCSGLTGDCSNLRGDCSNLRGDCTDLRGDLDQAELTPEERKNGVDISQLVD